MDETARAIGQLESSIDILTAQVKQLNDRVEELNSLKNKGWGVLAGVSLLSAILGSSIAKTLHDFLG